MKRHRAVGLVTLALLTQACDSAFFGCDSGPEEDAEPPVTTPWDTAPPDVAPPEARADPSAEDASNERSEQAEGGAFVPMAEDLIVRLVYGDDMDGPGWYRVTILDVDSPMANACETTIETTSENGMTEYVSDDYTCMASVFNANSENRTDPDEFALIITSSLGYEGQYLLTWEGGSFTNEQGNVIEYSVP